jgi:hypothetical protein
LTDLVRQLKAIKGIDGVDREISAH